jgi:hypothetical protein
MASATARGSRTHPTVKAVLQCLAVGSQASYRTCRNELDRLTTRTQADERVRRDKQLFLFSRKFETSRYFMLVFRVTDDRGNELRDYNIVFTAGPDYNANHLPPGFFVDRQRNSRCAGQLTYYLDYDVMAAWFARPQLEDRFGFEVSARPDAGYAYYSIGRYQGKFSTLQNYFAPNQTVMVEIVLQRTVMEGVFRLTQELTPEDFRKQPAGRPL